MTTGTPIEQACWQPGVFEPTCYRCRREYGAKQAGWARSLKGVEFQSRHLPVKPQRQELECPVEQVTESCAQYHTKDCNYDSIVLKSDQAACQDEDRDFN